MTTEPKRIYLYRSNSHGRDTVVCVAPIDLAVAAYGGGGHHDQRGVEDAFGGSAYYRNDETGDCFIGVWGARNASRFRTALRRKSAVVITREPPPARLLWWTTAKERPPASAQRGID